MSKKKRWPTPGHLSDWMGVYIQIATMVWWIVRIYHAYQNGA